MVNALGTFPYSSPSETFQNAMVNYKNCHLSERVKYSLMSMIQPNRLLFFPSPWSSP